MQVTVGHHAVIRWGDANHSIGEITGSTDVTVTVRVARNATARFPLSDCVAVVPDVTHAICLLRSLDLARDELRERQALARTAHGKRVAAILAPRPVDA